MNRIIYKIIFAVIVLIVFGGVTALTQIKPPSEPGDKQRSGQTGNREPALTSGAKTNLSAVINEPHQVLVMVYMQNIGLFAKALQDQAQVNNSLSADFARAIVAEISQSFDKAEEHHREHMKTVGAGQPSRDIAMMKMMDTRQSKLKEAIVKLESDVRDYTLKPQQIARDTAVILKYIDDMTKMYDGN
jgi:hypothetical protein